MVCNDAPGQADTERNCDGNEAERSASNSTVHLSQFANPDAGLHGECIVVLSLVNPREKFWGALLRVNPSGIWIRGLDLGSFDGTVAMIREGEQSSSIEVFFPMHRVERMEADAETNGIPSLQQRFEKATGTHAGTFLGCTRRR